MASGHVRREGKEGREGGQSFSAQHTLNIFTQRKMSAEARRELKVAGTDS